MLAAVAVRLDKDDPLAGLKVGDWPEPVPLPGWTTVTVRAATLNHHDLWTLRGVGITADKLPVVLGTDGAGIDDQGNEVVLYPFLGNPLAGGGDETLDPALAMLSVEHDGTFAQRVSVPRDNLVPKPACMSFEEAACLPGAWLTAYRMLFEKSGLPPGGTVLVQGAGGGVATALVVLGAAAGYRVWATSRSRERGQRAVRLGAELAFDVGARLPQRVDAVMETVGAATWDHSMSVVRPGGRVVVCGATTGSNPPIDLKRLFFRQISVVGSTGGTRAQLHQLVRFCQTTGVRPLLHEMLPLHRAYEGFAAMTAGQVFGKIVFTMD
jgi:NADPH:quinone reductase-like Zn-dependent oxidoreductase